MPATKRKTPSQDSEATSKKPKIQEEPEQLEELVEHNLSEDEKKEGKIPVTILTGFLGAGKTTFVNYLLREHHGHRLAIIENEFGEVGIDGGLVMQNEGEEIVEMMNGCICCTVREDLVGVLDKLYKQRRKFEAIIIETTGLADPAPVAQTFFAHESVEQRFKLDAIVTFIDCKHIITHLDQKKAEGVENEAVEQVAFADRLVLNKIDLVSAEELKTVKARLRSINAEAKMLECQQSRLPVDQVLNIGAFNLEKTLEMDEEFLNIDAEHQHDSTVSSVGICVDGELRPERFQKWMQELLRTKGNDIYRSKGIIAFMGNDQKYAFQGVHMMLDFAPVKIGNVPQMWGRDELRTNRMCFIGKNLDRKQLQDDVKACVSDGKMPDPGSPPDVDLRFDVGDQVVANCGDWTPGVIVKQWYRETMWETGKFAAYQIRLNNGGLIYAPRDSDVFVRLVRRATR